MGDYTVLPPEVALVTNEVCLLLRLRLSLIQIPELGNLFPISTLIFSNRKSSKVGWLRFLWLKSLAY